MKPLSRYLQWPARGFAEAASTADTIVRWPMLFALEPCDETLLSTARHGLDVSYDYAAEPARVQQTFIAFVGDPPWAPGFVGVDWWTAAGRLDGATMDELYLFMAMRVHVVRVEPGRSAVLRVSRWSMPFARRMIQLIETLPLPGGLTRLRYRVAYEAPWYFSPLLPLVQAVFRLWFRFALRGLDRYLRREDAIRQLEGAPGPDPAV